MGHAPTLEGNRDAMFSCKFLLIVAFTFTTLIALPLGAEAQRGGRSSGAPPSYLGPCDVITGGCAEAYSMTRAMTARYGGSLFQLVRLSDNARLNVGQKNHVVDTSRIPTFCDGTYCLYSEIYAQVNGNNFIPATTANGAATPAYCTTANACAALFWIDPTTGLPAIRTAYPSEYVYEPSSTGITGGTNALSVMMDGRNEGFSTCCGAFGISHPSHSPDTRGTMMTIWLDYGNAINKFMSCRTPTTFCMGIDEESANRDGADYGSSLGDVISLITFTGGATRGTVTGTVNGTQIFSHTPTNANTLGANMAIGTAMRLGDGGDLSHVDVIFREGLITNGVASVRDEAAARNNMTTFYGAHSPAACQSTADMSYYFGANYTDNPVASSLLAVGLRQMRASQTGPIVDLRDVVTNTVNTYGPATSGCGIDPAAATFCATNGCAVATLYNQGTFSTRTSSSAYDFTLSMTATSTSAQPIVTFNSLNGLPTMHFTGTQMLCTGRLPNLTLPNVPIGWSVVAKRAPSAGAGAAAAEIYTPNGAVTLLGWGSRVNTFNYWVATRSPYFAGPASDGHWHQMGWESNSRAGNVANDYLDGATLSSSVTVGVSGTSFRSGQVCIGGRPDTGPSLSGDVAELVISLPKAPTSVGFSSLEPTIFARDEAAWGRLPH
jgi:Alpha-L-arabinofuranosidase B, catalytic